MDMDFLNQMVSNENNNLHSMSQKQPIMLIFLRHFGCVFCQQTLSDIAHLQEDIQKKGVKIVFVHMSEESVADTFFKKYNIQNPEHISDPSGKFYSYFGLEHGKVSQLFGLNTFIKGMKLSLEGYKLEVNKKLGNTKQMPGIFILYKDAIVNKFVHKVPADQPNYMNLLDNLTITV